MGSTEDSVIASEPVIHKFGDEELSDVTFVVGGEEFKCHKMTLACRSSYFKAMFFSDFKEKDQDRVSIEADPIAFNQLMEILYSKKYNSWDTLVRCSIDNRCRDCTGNTKSVRIIAINGISYNNCQPVLTLWQQCAAVLKLADQFDLLKDTISALENCFVRGGYVCGCSQNNCARLGLKLIIAVIYGMEEFKENCNATRAAVSLGMNVIKRIQPTLPLDIDQIQFLMMRN